MKKATQSLFDHLCLYTPEHSKRKPYRSTQIIATISRTATKDEISQLVAAGMNIARFDAPNGKDDFKEIEQSLGLLREAVDEYNEKRIKNSDKQNAKIGSDQENPDKCPTVHVASALDLKGSYIETGTFEQGNQPAPVPNQGIRASQAVPDPNAQPPRRSTVTNAGRASVYDQAWNFQLVTGETINLTNNKDYSTEMNKDWLYIEYKDLLNLQPGQLVIVNKSVKLKVESVKEADKAVNCQIEQGGELDPAGKMEVNIPGARIGSMATKEMAIPAIQFCVDQDIDILIAPINSPEDFGMLRCSLNDMKKPIKVIAKVEAEEAVQKVDKIIERADGVIVSRSRLGRNISPEQVVVYQKNIIAKCLKAGISSIVAGHVLKSVENGKAGGTRAEIADVVNSVLDGVDCVMLDEKVSTQNCIETLQNTIMEAEDMINYRRWFYDLLTQVSIPPSPVLKADDPKSHGFTNVIAISAVTAATVNAANAIIVLTETGKTVRMISKYRPECPIIAVAATPAIARQCLLSRGVFSITAEGELKLNFFIFGFYKRFLH